MLYRYFLMLGKCLWTKREGIESVGVSKFRVMPWDLDINFHLTNSRYPMLLNVARTKCVIQLGLCRFLLAKRVKPVLTSQTVSFIKEVKPFAALTVESRISSWDSCCLYVEHRFLVDDTLHGTAIASVVFSKNKHIYSFDTVLKQRDLFYGEAEGVYISPDKAPEVASTCELQSLLRKKKKKLKSKNKNIAA